MWNHVKYYSKGKELENWPKKCGKIPRSVKNFARGGPIRWKLQSTIGWWRWRQKLPQQKWYSWFWIISTRLTQNATRKHGTSAKSHWKNYILLWKNEIYSGKHLEKSWKNDPEKLCEPCHSHKLELTCNSSATGNITVATSKQKLNCWSELQVLTLSSQISKSTVINPFQI